MPVRAGGMRFVVPGDARSRIRARAAPGPRMRAMSSVANAARGSGVLAALARGFRFRWTTLLLLAAINTGIAAVLWVDDARPFWHPLLTVQLYGFSIAYCVNAASPWEKRRPILRLAIAVAIGTLIGVTLTILVKGYSWDYVVSRAQFFGWNIFTGFANGLFVSLFFYVKYRETQAAAALHKAEAERHLLSKQAIEAELKLMQAQVEPHFLFNTLASVHYLTETDPKEANRLLGHLIDYLRAALPQLRASSTTLGKEVKLATAYLQILRTRMGPRLAFDIDVPDELAQHPFPPNLLISLVENAIKHGIEPAAEGGSVQVRARSEQGALVVTVQDTGRGLALPARGGQGVGLNNVRDRLAALYGTQGSFRLEAGSPTGTRATLAIPLEVRAAA
jgi:sensor histidine kinase YesM